MLDPAGVPVPDGVKVRNWRSSVCWTLFVGPTSLHCRHAARVPAPHGNWTIRVTRKRGADVSATVHAYLSRAHPNLGARTGARDSRFVDPEWESKAGGRTLLHPERIPVPGQSIVERNGTLSGIATGSTAVNDVPTRVYVAGSVRAVDGRKARYSSVGPAREGSADPFGRPPGFMRRDGPDACFPTDETWALQGTPGAGNRAGTVFRLIGTSAAAPQLARWLANRPPSSRNSPEPDQLSGIAPCGGP